MGARLSRQQWRMVRVMEALARDECLLPVIAARDMGRTAVKVEDQHRVLAALARASSSFEEHHSYTTVKPSRAFLSNTLAAGGMQPSSPLAPSFGTLAGFLPARFPCTAKPIQASRLSFPPPPAFDPRGYLDAATAERFERPLKFSAHAASEINPPQRVKILATHSEKLQLFKDLAASGRLLPFKASPDRIPYAAGLFAVTKDLQRDRLVLDARPANTLEVPPAFWSSTLASSAVLGQIVLRPNERLTISTADLKDFFYLFKIGAERLERNLLQGALSREEAREVFGQDCSSYADARGRVRVALATLAMGDNGACEYAQGSHVAVLCHHGVLSPEDLLLPSRPPPRGLLSIGVVIDDLVILERLLRSAPIDDEHCAGGRRLDKAHQAYCKAHLVANPKKGVRVRNVARASFWGVDLDGEAGLMRPNPQRLWPLCVITARVATLGLVSRELLESLVGSWTSVFLVRWRCLALFSIFAMRAACLPGPADHPPQPDPSRRGVEFGARGAPLCGQLVLDALFATDASDDALACVRADLPAGVADELFRHTLVKGAWARLLPPPLAWLRSKGLQGGLSELPDGTSFTPHPMWRALVRSLKFGLWWTAEARISQHINLKELKAYLRLERDVASRMLS